MKTLVFITILLYISMVQCNLSNVTCPSCQEGYFLTPQKKCKECPRQCNSCFLRGGHQILQCIIDPIKNGTYSLTSIEGPRSLRVVFGQYIDLSFYYLQWEVWQIETSIYLGASSIFNKAFSFYMTANCNGVISITKEPTYEWIIRRVTYNVYTIKNTKCGYLYSLGQYVSVVKDQEDSRNVLWVIKDFSLPGLTYNKKNVNSTSLKK